MYSNSSSFLGGANSARPGPLQYGQSSFSHQPNGNQQPAGYNASQQTGFGGGPLQQQYTGFPVQGEQRNFQSLQQQPPYTGYPQNQQQPQNQLPQQQSFQISQPPSQQVLPQKTGQTSSQIAQSFSTAPPTQSSAPQAPTSSAKIPKIRLSFLTATDQAKFEQLFKSAVGDGQALDGRRSRINQPCKTDRPKEKKLRIS